MENAQQGSRMAHSDSWPTLPLQEWQDTHDTLHMWLQIVGKIRLAQAPHINHWWEVPLYLTSRGLTTTPIRHGDGTFDIDFDFIDHQLQIRANDGASYILALEPRTVADFYREIMGALDRMGLPVKIWPVPVEVTDPIPFAQDTRHASYNAEQVHRFWQILLIADQVLKQFRGRFIGKCSPVQFFWGGFDLALSFYSGRTAPLHPPVPYAPLRMILETYSHEMSDCGFYFGSGPITSPVFYAYAYPEPPGYAQAHVRPHAAFYSQEMGEFILPYDEIRTSNRAREMILEFLDSTYEAAADLLHWDRDALERKAPPAS